MFPICHISSAGIEVQRDHLCVPETRFTGLYKMIAEWVMLLGWVILLYIKFVLMNDVAS